MVVRYYHPIFIMSVRVYAVSSTIANLRAIPLLNRSTFSNFSTLSSVLFSFFLCLPSVVLGIPKCLFPIGFCSSTHHYSTSGLLRVCPNHRRHPASMTSKLLFSPYAISSITFIGGTNNLVVVSFADPQSFFFFFMF